MRNVKLSRLEEKLDKRINEIQLENKSREIDRLDRNKDKVSSSGNDDKINKNNSVDVGSNNESLMRVEVHGEVIVVDESESGGKESLNEYSEQRANFPSGIVGVKTPKLLFEEEGSSRVYVGDVWSPNDPLVFCVSVPGEARRCFYEIVVPDANI